jgi:hypothetical protein
VPYAEEDLLVKEDPMGALVKNLLMIEYLHLGDETHDETFHNASTHLLRVLV